MGSNPCRRIPLLSIAHLVVGKYFQVLEVHQEVDTFEVLVGKKVMSQKLIEFLVNLYDFITM